MGEYWDFDRLTKAWAARGLNRRDLMKLIGAGASAVALGTRPRTALAQGATPSPQPQQGGQVSVLWRKPVTLSPLFSTSGSEQQVERLMFGSLVKMSDKLVPTPDLAEKIEVSDDVKVYTFHLHKNIMFSDGHPLTAKDVVFTFERAIDKRTGSIWRSRLLGIAGAEAFGDQKAESISGLATPDDYTVQVTLAEPDATFLLNLCNYSGLGILPQHVLGEVPPDQLEQHPFSLAPNVSAGAMKFGQFKTDEYLELVRNDQYFGTPAPLDTLYMQILTPDVGLAKLETGEINLMALPTSEVERVRKLQGVTVASVPSPSMSRLECNFERSYLQSKELRQAMMYAIDRAGILKQIFQGEGEIVNSPIFGPDWMGVPEGLNPYAYDPGKAKELVGQSGYDKNQKIQLLVYVGEAKETQTAATIMQQQLQDVGINFELLQVDLAELNRRYIQESDFDMFFNGGDVYRADPSVAGTYLTTAAFTPGGGNGSHYSNPDLDKLFAQGKEVKDLTERKKIYTQVAQILNDDVPWIYLWSPNSIYGFTDNLHGFAPPSYTDNKLWNAETWWVSK
jgi:peptide/nickel transport system substrate-binding protein